MLAIDRRPLIGSGRRLGSVNSGTGSTVTSAWLYPRRYLEPLTASEERSLGPLHKASGYSLLIEPVMLQVGTMLSIHDLILSPLKVGVVKSRLCYAVILVSCDQCMCTWRTACITVQSDAIKNRTRCPFHNMEMLIISINQYQHFPKFPIPKRGSSGIWPHISRLSCGVPSRYIWTNSLNQPPPCQRNIASFSG